MAVNRCGFLLVFLALGIVALLGVVSFTLVSFQVVTNRRQINRLLRWEGFYSGELAAWHAVIRDLSTSTPAEIAFENLVPQQVSGLEKDSYSSQRGEPVNVLTTNDYAPNKTLVSHLKLAPWQHARITASGGHCGTWKKTRVCLTATAKSAPVDVDILYKEQDLGFGLLSRKNGVWTNKYKNIKPENMNANNAGFFDHEKRPQAYALTSANPASCEPFYLGTVTANGWEFFCQSATMTELGVPYDSVQAPEGYTHAITHRKIPPQGTKDYEPVYLNNSSGKWIGYPVGNANISPVEAGFLGGDPSIASRAGGYAYFLLNCDRADVGRLCLWEASKDGAFQAEKIVGADCEKYGGFSSVAVDAAGNVHIVYSCKNGGNPWEFRLARRDTAKNFQTFVLQSAPSCQMDDCGDLHPKMFSDEKGATHIAWSIDSPNDHTNYYCEFKNDTCQKEIPYPSDSSQYITLGLMRKLYAFNGRVALVSDTAPSPQGTENGRPFLLTRDPNGKWEYDKPPGNFIAALVIDLVIR